MLVIVKALQFSVQLGGIGGETGSATRRATRRVQLGEQLEELTREKQEGSNWK